MKKKVSKNKIFLLITSVILIVVIITSSILLNTRNISRNNKVPVELGIEYIIEEETLSKKRDVANSNNKIIYKSLHCYKISFDVNYKTKLLKEIENQKHIMFSKTDLEWFDKAVLKCDDIAKNEIIKNISFVNDSNSYYYVGNTYNNRINGFDISSFPVSYYIYIDANNLKRGFFYVFEYGVTESG